jgi:hypothetical protein
MLVKLKNDSFEAQVLGHGPHDVTTIITKVQWRV